MDERCTYTFHTNSDPGWVARALSGGDGGSTGSLNCGRSLGEEKMDTEKFDRTNTSDQWRASEVGLRTTLALGVVMTQETIG